MCIIVYVNAVQCTLYTGMCDFSFLIISPLPTANQKPKTITFSLRIYLGYNHITWIGIWYCIIYVCTIIYL